MAASTERVRVALPKGFDPARHMKALEKLIGDAHGDGFEIDSLEGGMAVATRQVAITEVHHTEKSKTKEVRLPRTVKPADGEKMAVKLADQHGDGWEMTKFEPFLGRATLTQLSPEVARCRGAAALALGVKPWDVQVAPRPDGGFDLELPRTYMPSKHDAKLEEVATAVVGRDGWYLQVDTQKLTASLIPSEPPTFPKSIPYPMAKLGKQGLDTLPFGMILPSPGETVGPEIAIDFVGQAFGMVAGTPGSGKSVTLNACIAGALAAGSELCIIDIPAKAVDFMWCKQYVRPGGWGCDSAEAAVAVLSMIYEEGSRRAKILADRGVVNWLDIPEKERFKPILIVIDEVSGLLVTDKMPTGIPKDHPLALEIAQTNLMRVSLASYISKIIAELRFVGMRMILSTQVTNNNTGIGPSLKAKIGHKILQGPNPSKSARGQAFNDETAVPNVPANIRADAKVAKGVGVAELEGAEPAVYKSYFATVSDYLEALTRLRVPTTDRPAPTAAEIARHTPSLEDEREVTAARREAMPDPMAGMMGDSGLDESGRPLKGAALAASQSRVLSNMGGRA